MGLVNHDGIEILLPISELCCTEYEVFFAAIYYVIANVSDIVTQWRN